MTEKKPFKTISLGCHSISGDNCPCDLKKPVTVLEYCKFRHQKKNYNNLSTNAQWIIIIDRPLHLYKPRMLFYKESYDYNQTI